MAIILGLLILCLGLYFLTVFFQVARLEKSMTESVTLLEKFMIVTYALDKKPLAGAAKDDDAAKTEKKP
jgi:hypothetical protein